MLGNMRFWANLRFYPIMVLEELNFTYKLHSVFGLQLQNRRDKLYTLSHFLWQNSINPYPTTFPYGNGMVLRFYQQQESSTTKTVHKVINKGLKAYV